MFCNDDDSLEGFATLKESSLLFYFIFLPIFFTIALLDLSVRVCAASGTGSIVSLRSKIIEQKMWNIIFFVNSNVYSIKLYIFVM